MKPKIKLDPRYRYRIYFTDRDSGMPMVATFCGTLRELGAYWHEIRYA